MPACCESPPGAERRERNVGFDRRVQARIRSSHPSSIAPVPTSLPPSVREHFGEPVAEEFRSLARRDLSATHRPPRRAPRPSRSFGSPGRKCSWSVPRGALPAGRARGTVCPTRTADRPAIRAGRRAVREHGREARPNERSHPVDDAVAHWTGCAVRVARDGAAGGGAVFRWLSVGTVRVEGPALRGRGGGKGGRAKRRYCKCPTESGGTESPFVPPPTWSVPDALRAMAKGGRLVDGSQVPPPRTVVLPEPVTRRDGKRSGPGAGSAVGSSGKERAPVC